MNTGVWAHIAFVLLIALFGTRSGFSTDCSDRGFLAAGTFRAGTVPSSVTVGDFNRDGRSDLAVANEFSATVSILLGGGDGTFSNAVDYNAGSAPSAVATGDFNRDQKIDLAVANAGSTNVSILIGNGDGSFQAPVGYGAGQIPRSVTVADFNRDGSLDLALANRLSADVSVLLGRGNGTFQNATTHAVGNDPVWVATGDFNGDTNVDLTVANSALFAGAPSVSVLLARTPTGFRNAVDYSAGVSPRAVAVRDFNGDGRLDLAVANFGGFVGGQFTNASVSVLLGVGDGTFESAVNYRAGDGPISVIAEDLNGNGEIDLAVANNRSQTVSVLSGLGNGTFAPAINYSAGLNPRSLATADFNADGHPDLAVVNDSGVLVLANICLTNTDLAITMDGPNQVAAGDRVIYTLTLTNSGPVPAPDTSIVDQLPGGVSFVSATSSQGRCVHSSGTVNCSLGNIQVDGTVTVTITVTAANAGVYTNAATARSSATIDPNPADNSATVATTVLPLVSLVVSDPSASETGPDSGTFTIRRTGSTSGALTVNYTLGGTASNGVDYVALSGSVMIPNGAPAVVLTVTPVDELAVELTEDVIVTLAPDAAYLINQSASNGTVRIMDNDTYRLSIDDVSVIETDSGTASAVFTVSLSYPNPEAVTVDYFTTDGTALAGSDYQATNGMLTFPPGTTSQSATVSILGDELNEADETFRLNLVNAINAVITDPQGIGTITNDDPLPTISISDAIVAEGDSGRTNAIFTISLSALSGQTVTVKFATSNGVASASSDYVATNGMLTFTPGVVTQDIVVAVNGDLLNESDETFLVNLAGATNAVLMDFQATGTINNDDPLPTISISDALVAEGDSGPTNAIFVVSLSAVSGQTVTVTFATEDEVASAGADYAATNGILTFTPGVVTQQLAVAVNGDLLHEDDETFLVNLDGATNAVITDSQGIGTITNDDPLPTISISDALVAEGDSGQTYATFTVTLSPASSQTVTVNFATADEVASAGADYAATDGMLTFMPGVVTQELAVAVNGDLLNESDETFLVNLEGATNAVLGDGQGMGTIGNDDPLPAISISDVTVAEGDSGETNVILTVSLSALSGQTVTLHFATADGVASAGADYVATNGMLTFMPGVLTQDLIVTVIGDLLNEGDETFLVNLADATNAIISDSQALGTIGNDDPLPTLTIDDVTVTEGGSEGTNATFTVSLSPVSGQTVTVEFMTMDDTAAAGADYVATNGVLSFAPGATSHTVDVKVLGDHLNETNKTLFLMLSNSANAIISDSQGAATILDDDAPELLLSTTSVHVPEGSTNFFAVRLNSSPPETVTVTTTFASGDEGLVASAGANLVFDATNWNVDQTVVISALDDDDLLDAQSSFTVSGAGFPDKTVNAVGLDNDLPMLSSCVGDDAMFAATPFGAGPFTYSWSKDGAALPDQTNASLVLTNVMLTDSGAYSVQIEGPLYTLTKSGALAVKTPVNATPLSSLTNCPGSSAVFSTVASGDGPFTYQWSKDGGELMGETNSLLEITSVAPSDAGVYGVKVTGACGTATSSATLTVGDAERCLRIMAVELDGADIIISFSTVPNEYYRVEQAAELAGSPWDPVADEIPGTGGIVQQRDVGAAGHATRFYRIVLLPETVPPEP